ncbi:putative toxin-antitoxin system toxin component, PIN family [Candidatus Woesearchaeota archaeon]|nr:putative toxin-antitoxin system toxin component, PIN family [Candidatus Woesearchaeota archaeon]
MDTNIVISAAISSDGNPALIFEMLILEEIENYTTQKIIDEIKAVFQRPRITKIVSLIEQNFMVNTFEQFSEIITPNVNFKEIKDDPDDDKFLDCAVSVSAYFIISGDEHLLKLQEFRGIKIINPLNLLN